MHVPRTGRGKTFPMWEGPTNPKGANRWGRELSWSEQKSPKSQLWSWGCVSGQGWARQVATDSTAGKRLGFLAQARGGVGVHRVTRTDVGAARCRCAEEFEGSAGRPWGRGEAPRLRQRLS